MLLHSLALVLTLVAALSPVLLEHPHPGDVHADLDEWRMVFLAVTSNTADRPWRAHALPPEQKVLRDSSR